MNERQGVWFLAALFGLLFVLVNAVNLVFVGGDAVRDVVAIGLGALLTIIAFVRLRPWKGARD